MFVGHDRRPPAVVAALARHRFCSATEGHGQSLSFRSGPRTASRSGSPRAVSSSESTSRAGQCGSWPTLRCSSAARGTLTAPSCSCRTRTLAVFRVSDRGGDPVAVTPSCYSHEAAIIFRRCFPTAGTFCFLWPAIRRSAAFTSRMSAARRLDVCSTPTPPRYTRRQGTCCSSDRAYCWHNASTLLRQTIAGSPFPVVDDIAAGDFAGANIVAASASAAGPIVYRTGFSLPSVRLDVKWLDRSGKEIVRFPKAPRFMMNPSLSPDERRIAFFFASDIWLSDLQSGDNRFTFDPAVDFSGIWSPDGNHIAFCSNRNGAYDLYQKNVSGAGGEELLLATPEQKAPTDWSADGRYLLYRSLDPKTSFDIWALSMSDRKSFPVVKTEHEERDAQFSPDGKWIAYQSNESGRFEIWVRPFPFPGADVKADERLQISTNGGSQVRWARNGSEIFYAGSMAGSWRCMSEPNRTGALSRRARPSRCSSRSGRRSSAVAPPCPGTWSRGTASRFLMTVEPPPVSTIPIRVLLNWKPQP